MNTSVKALFDRLSQVEPRDVPAGEAGVLVAEAMATRHCIPVLSVYLDARPLHSGDQPAMRASLVIVRERLHQIAQTFWPRGVAYETVQADIQRIEAYLDTAVSPATRGVAIFAGQAHHLFETLTSDVPFENEVSALAMPDLFQLANLLDDREVAVVAVAHTHAVRLFVTHRGGMREVRGRAADPKDFHQVRSTNAMNQAHYQRHARQVRTKFAREVATQIAHLVEQTGATEIILGGDAVAIPILHQALQATAPQTAQLIHTPSVPLELEAPFDTIWEEVEPLLEAAQEQHQHTLVAELIAAIQADGLGVAGYEATRAALEAGRADVLLMTRDVPLSEEIRDELLALASRGDAQVEIIAHDAALDALGGVGTLVRYRTNQVMVPEA